MRTALALATLIFALGAAAPACAQSDDSAKLREQLRYVTLQLHQAQDDQAAILAQKAAAETERDAVKKQLASVQAELARARRDGQRVRAVEGDLTKARDALTQATSAAAQTQAERDKFHTAASNTQTVLEACQARNVQLLKVSREILAAYEGFDFVDSAEAREPFTRLKRVELENLAQDYHDRIDDGVFDPKAVRTPVPPEHKQQPGSTVPKPGG